MIADLSGNSVRNILSPVNFNQVSDDKSEINFKQPETRPASKKEMAVQTRITLKQLRKGAPLMVSKGVNAENQLYDHEIDIIDEYESDNEPLNISVPAVNLAKKKRSKSSKKSSSSKSPKAKNGLSP